jgi:transcriptional regulator with XRE-family HTH domain
LNRGDFGMIDIFSKRLKELRLKHGLNRQELAKELNISPITLAGYENGHRSPNIDYITQIADYFNVSTDWLLGRSDDDKTAYKSHLISHLKYIAVVKNIVARFVKENKIPSTDELKEKLEINILTELAETETFRKTIEDVMKEYELIKVIKGPGSKLDFEEQFGYDLIKKNALDKNKTYFKYIYNDESMKNSFLPSERLLFAKINSIDDIPDKEIVLFKQYDQHLIRRFYRSDSHIILQADNPDYQPIVYNPQDPIEVIGTYYMKAVYEDDEQT